MKYISIPGLDKKVSELVMGTIYFRPSNIDFTCEMLDAFVAAGGNTLDTAHIYCGGESEQAIGLWLEKRGRSDDIVILTKGAHHDKDGPRVTPACIASDLKDSLERLKVETIDMYALHRDDPNVPVGVIIEALNEHIAAGRIRTIGGSNWTHERLQEANDYAAAHGLVGFTFNSPNLSLAKPNEPRWPGCVSADDSMIDWHERTQMPLLSWSSQAGGFFSGRFAPDKLDDQETVRVYYSEANWKRYDRAVALAERKGVSAIQIACAYVLHQPFPACALIGPQTIDEMNSSMEAIHIKLTPEEVAWLDLKSETSPLALR